MANANYTFLGNSTNPNQLVAANSRRIELIVTNTSTATLYLGFGRVSITDYTVALPYQATFITGINDQVKGMWAVSAAGQANITEVF